jgi:methylthioribose-1-phosphate isomerase
MLVDGKHYRTVWIEQAAREAAAASASVPTVKMVEQRSLPHKFEIGSFGTYQTTGLAIRDMTVRGAGAIGATAGFAMAQAAATLEDGATLTEVEEVLSVASSYIQTMRCAQPPSLFRLLRVFTSLLYCNATAHHGAS